DPPARTALGTDIVRDHERMREVTCPFTGDRLLAVGALRPDLTILHAQRCDRHGNAHLWGNLGISLEAARAAETVLLTCEELVDDAIITGDPNRTLVPGFLVSAVAEVPFGSHPSPTQGYVNRDDRFYDEYHEETRARAGLLAWLDRMVLGTRGHAGYLSRLGEDRMERLRPRTPPPAAPIITMGDPPNIAGALMCTTLVDVMSHLQRGRVDVGFLGGAEVDRFGNLNTTWAEDRGRRIRLPGSGGAADIAALARRTVVLVHHERRRFPERVRYLTSPGFGTGRGWRETVGLVRGGPGRVITSLGVFGFDPESGEMVLESLHPGVTLEELRAETG